MRIKSKMKNVSYDNVRVEEVESDIEVSASEIVQIIKELIVALFTVKTNN